MYFQATFNCGSGCMLKQRKIKIQMGSLLILHICLMSWGSVNGNRWKKSEDYKLENDKKKTGHVELERSKTTPPLWPAFPLCFRPKAQGCLSGYLHNTPVSQIKLSVVMLHCGLWKRQILTRKSNAYNKKDAICSAASIVILLLKTVIEVQRYISGCKYLNRAMPQPHGW